MAKIIDKIRTLDDEDIQRFAEWLSNLTDCGFCNCCCDNDFNKRVHRICDSNCKQCVLERLYSEVSK